MRAVLRCASPRLRHDGARLRKGLVAIVVQVTMVVHDRPRVRSMTSPTDDQLREIVRLAKDRTPGELHIEIGEEETPLLWVAGADGLATVLFYADWATPTDAAFHVAAVNRAEAMADELLQRRAGDAWRPIGAEVREGQLVAGCAIGAPPIVGRLRRDAYRDACPAGAVAVVDEARQSWAACTHYIALPDMLSAPLGRDADDAPPTRLAIGPFGAEAAAMPRHDLSEPTRRRRE
jgi:hypothetical protein